MAYDNDTCRVVGTLRRPSGAIMAATAIHLVQDTIRRAWDGAALPVVQTVVSDGNGVVDFHLIPGHYRLVWQDAAGQAEHRLWVPDAPFVWLADAAQGFATLAYYDGAFTYDGTVKFDGVFVLQP